MQSRDGRFTYLALPIGTAFGGLPQPIHKDLPYGHALDGVAPMSLLQPFLTAAGVSWPVSTEGSKVIVLDRESANGGRILFVLNLENSMAEVRLRLPRKPGRVEDLLDQRKLGMVDGGVVLQIAPRDLRVLHTAI